MTLDAFNQTDTLKPGRSIIPLPTIISNPMFYAVPIVRAMGKSDDFIALATNPKWTEVKIGLFPMEHARDRPDISSLCASP